METIQDHNPHRADLNSKSFADGGADFSYGHRFLFVHGQPALAEPTLIKWAYSNTNSTSIEITTGDNRILIVSADEESDFGVSSVTLDGQPLTSVKGHEEPSGAGNSNSIIVVAIMILVLLTILGLTAVNTSTTEQHLATNTLLYEKAFYAAEAGFEHAKGVLKVPYNEKNQSNIALGNPGSWSFVLEGSGVIPGLAAAEDCAPLDGGGYCAGGDGVGDFEGGVVLVQSDLGGISYTVTVWNNDDSASGGTPTSDTDGRLMIRTAATGPRGATCAIESLIEGTTDSGSMNGHKAQAGAGKSYRNNDLESITDFTQQM